MCRFTMEDEGPGIPLEERRLVFEKYCRGRAAEGKPGAGLGLALVQRIVELHDGMIELQARQPRGTRFVIDIPLLVGPVA